jgi:hypothetical protein
MALQRGSITQEVLQQALAQPSADLQYSALNAIAQQNQLDQQARAALFEQAQRRDYEQVGQAETLLNNIINSATAGLTDLPVNPKETGLNLAGNVAGGFSLPLAAGAATAAIPGGQLVAPFVPGAIGFGRGLLEAYDEASDRGESFSIPAGLLRGTQEAGLAYLPIGKALQRGGSSGIQKALGTAGEMARNAAIAGASELGVSPVSQYLSRGSINPNRVLTDLATQVGSQLGGDAFEGLRLRQGLNARPSALDIARSVRVRPRIDPQLEVAGRIVPREELQATQLSQAQEQFQTNYSQLQRIAALDEKQALKLARQSEQNANRQAGQYQQGSPENVTLRQHAREYGDFANRISNENTGVREVNKLESHRDNVAGFEMQGNTQQLKTLYRLGKRMVVAGKTDASKESARALQVEAGQALQRLGVDPETSGKVKVTQNVASPEEKAALRKVAEVEKTEQEYINMVGRDGERLADGLVRVKDIQRINEKARRQEVDPDSPEWLRQYAANLRAQTDEDLAVLRQNEQTQKAISTAKERTAVAANKPDKPIGLNQLKKDIIERSSTKPANEPVSPDTKAKNVTEGLAGRLKNTIGDKAAKIEAGDVKTGDVSTIRNAALKIENDPTLSLSTRAQAKRVRVAADQAINKINQQITKQRQDAQQAREATISKAKKEASPKKEAKNPDAAKKAKALATPYQKNLDKVHKGMTETPRAIQRKLDKAAGTDEVIEINYYAEKVSGGSSLEKDFLTRYVTVESIATDGNSRRLYTTIDQINGTKETRKLFDGVENSRITVAESSDIPRKYRLNDEGDVVDIKTGEVMIRSEADRMSTQSIEKQLKDAADSGTVKQRLNKINDILDKSATTKMTNEEMADWIKKQPESTRKAIYEAITGDKC